MAGSITVTYVKNDWGRLTSKMVSAAADQSKDTAQDIVDDAKRRVPVDTGELRDSIGKRREGIGWLVEATAEYAGFVEYGTRHMAAQPYLTPAAEGQRGWVRKLADALGSVG